MQQYLDLLRKIKEKGTLKSAAREGMPGTVSLFGPQMEFNLADGFPILTTKKVNFKHIVTELLWFLNGDTNIKYLVDNGCNIWNEDAYNYYKKLGGKHYSFEKFIEVIKWNSLNGLLERGKDEMFKDRNYKLGDCGKQYGWLWRSWEKYNPTSPSLFCHKDDHFYKDEVDQIKELIEGLQNNPMSRRHILTAWNPATLDDMALNACHAFVQFNCRPLSLEKRKELFLKDHAVTKRDKELLDNTDFNNVGIPKYYLDCKMYQRSADVFLGVPYNISSYALLTEIIAKTCNMIPGQFIHSFGDVHIYENHLEQVDEILTRTPDVLPKLVITNELPLWKGIYPEGLELSFEVFIPENFKLEGYNPQSAIKAKLSTGLK